MVPGLAPNAGCGHRIHLTRRRREMTQEESVSPSTDPRRSRGSSADDRCLTFLPWSAWRVRWRFPYASSSISARRARETIPDAIESSLSWSKPRAASTTPTSNSRWSKSKRSPANAPAGSARQIQVELKPARRFQQNRRFVENSEVKALFTVAWTGSPVDPSNDRTRIGPSGTNRCSRHHDVPRRSGWLGKPIQP